jgi:hypothetical protein
LAKCVRESPRCLQNFKTAPIPSAANAARQSTQWSESLKAQED